MIAAALILYGRNAGQIASRNLAALNPAFGRSLRNRNSHVKWNEYLRLVWRLNVIAERESLFS
jgi:hypothetical protein